MDFLSAPMTIILALGTPLWYLKILEIPFDFRLVLPCLGKSHGLESVCAYHLGLSSLSSVFRSRRTAEGSAPPAVLAQGCFRHNKPELGTCLANPTQKPAGLFWAVPVSV